MGEKFKVIMDHRALFSIAEENRSTKSIFVSNADFIVISGSNFQSKIYLAPN